MISVLILTHKRPRLFQRCINSVLNAYNNFKIPIEIIVNNDSNDIEEKYFQNISITYTYNQNQNLGALYKDIYNRAKGEYVYFLEDDDVMIINFFRIISNYNQDIIYGNYIPYEWNSEFVSFFNKDEHNSKKDFLTDYDNTHFQFSQLCFRKQALDVINFPTDNNIENDFKVFELLEGTFVNIKKVLYKQTTDGKDNISFKKFNKDKDGFH